MSGGSSSEQSKMRRWLRAPVRVLARARDLYVHGMVECAGHLAGSSAMGCPTGQAASLSFNYAAGSSPLISCNDEKYLRELMKASTRNHMLGINKVQERPEGAASGRTYRAAMGRMDEEEPCEFEGEKVVLYPRGMSAYAVPKLRTGWPQ